MVEILLISFPITCRATCGPTTPTARVLSDPACASSRSARRPPPHCRRSGGPTSHRAFPRRRRSDTSGVSTARRRPGFACNPSGWRDRTGACTCGGHSSGWSTARGFPGRANPSRRRPSRPATRRERRPGDCPNDSYVAAPRCPSAGAGHPSRWRTAPPHRARRSRAYAGGRSCRWRAAAGGRFPNPCRGAGSSWRPSPWRSSSPGAPAWANLVGEGPACTRPGGGLPGLHWHGRSSGAWRSNGPHASGLCRPSGRTHAVPYP
jgi:hypothetical protein